MSKFSKHGFKFIMVVIDILSKYAWLEVLKFKHVKAIKSVLEHIFSERIRCPNIIQIDKEKKISNVFVKTYLANNNISSYLQHIMNGKHKLQND